MNSKESILYRIADAVVSCCATDIGGGEMSVTTEQVLSKCRAENVVMTRQILAMQIQHCGYTITTISHLLKCSAANVRKLIKDGYENLHHSRAFHFAYAEATLRCRSICGSM